jgi:porphobilinogen synthase
MARSNKISLVSSSRTDAPSVIDGINPLRARKAVRDFLAEPLVKPADLVQSLLVFDSPKNHPFLPTICISEIRKQAREMVKLGVRGVKLFTEYSNRDQLASPVTNPDNLMLRAIRAFKDAAPELCVIPETCVCTANNTGMCILSDDRNCVLVEKTHEVLARQALLQVEAGADIIGPSGMVDGAVSAIRKTLQQHGHGNVPIMPHVIINTSLYELYRQAMGLQARVGKLRPFHIDPTQTRQPVKQAEEFCNEGADMILLEPSMFTVDVLMRLRSSLDCPIGTFSVSGEYKMLLGASVPGLVDGTAIFMEFFTGLKRAGADFIVTYAACDTARWLNEQD